MGNLEPCAVAELRRPASNIGRLELVKGSAPPPTQATRGPGEFPPPPRSLSSEHAARWKEIVQRASTIDRANYFMMLDIARDATTDDVEDAFCALAKRWHPDRLPKALEPLHGACRHVFLRMSQARLTLTDPGQRAQYTKLMDHGSAVHPAMQAEVARVVEAATDFQKAEVCFKRGDYAQAESYCQRAWDGDNTQSDYVAMLAWLRALKPESATREETLECIKLLDSAIEISDRCEKAYFWRGLLYRRIDDRDAAIRDFVRVVELNPRHIDAVRELRLYRMRRDRGKSSGLLKRIFPQRLSPLRLATCATTLAPPLRILAACRFSVPVSGASGTDPEGGRRTALRLGSFAMLLRRGGRPNDHNGYIIGIGT